MATFYLLYIFFVFTYYFVLSLKNKYTTNNVQRSLTSLLLRVMLAHTLANIGDDAGAFILFSLVSATQRRPPAAVFVADARRQKYEPGFSLRMERSFNAGDKPSHNAHGLSGISHDRQPAHTVCGSQTARK